jgi:hypothetical protein
MTQPEPLSGAKLRHRRAQEHVADIEALVDRIEAERQFVFSHKDPQTGEEFLELPPALKPEDDLRVRLGECVYNLRAGLDYIVHVVSGGDPNSQFPLESSPQGFRGRITGRNPKTGRLMKPFLRNVQPHHRRLIRNVQPYKHVGWTRRLRDVSNKDKHRELFVINAITRQILTRETLGGLYPSDSLYPSNSRYPSGYEQVKVNGPVQIALPEGAPVREAVQELEAEVGNVLALFEGTL